MNHASPPSETTALMESPTPRRVSPALLRAVKKRAASRAGLFISGGAIAFTLIFCWGFFPTNFHLDQEIRSGNVQRTRGEVREVSPVNIELNGVRVWKYFFTYQREGDERVAEGECYATGLHWEPGEAVEVEYAPEHHRAARIAGARQSPVGAWALLLFLLPFAAFTVLLYLLFRRSRAVSLLRHGVPGRAVVEAAEPTSMMIHNHTVYRFRLRRRDGGPGVAEFTVRRHHPGEVEYLSDRARSGESVPLLYDPRHPSRIIFVETL